MASVTATKLTGIEWSVPPGLGPVTLDIVVSSTDNTWQNVVLTTTNPTGRMTVPWLHQGMRVSLRRTFPQPTVDLATTIAIHSKAIIFH